ncbi:MAG: diacylglycerol kinase family protein [Bacteroidales bacterium]|jgi:diacylglycerol kinase|nr:diacylglycerol kinase family protein [Bacteroidales bacterium]MDD2569666.1 diacylglycerol kinase family protein [Bacteroidales bacterium]MDD2813072.1 diacylglycerol kinase family protein [Bacteroidales bacterium]MDD3384777.1 diacylglycerol kinase family protein [Bacteroidales bacterium]MDD3810864.1 diacylglycerol kinase family protein [Bacteroidales bacterium]
MNSRRFSLTDRIKSFRFAFKGLRWLFTEEHNSWIYLLVIAVLIPLCIILHLSPLEWALIAYSIGSVIAAEIFNTAIERLADRITSETDLVIGKVKDLAAAGVLVTAVVAAVIGLIILVPKLL